MVLNYGCSRKLIQNRQVAHCPQGLDVFRTRGRGTSSSVSLLGAFPVSKAASEHFGPPSLGGRGGGTHSSAWEGWTCLGTRRVGVPGKRPVLGQVPSSEPLDIFLSTHHLARAQDLMSHLALHCFFLGQKQIVHQITGGGGCLCGN